MHPWFLPGLLVLPLALLLAPQRALEAQAADVPGSALMRGMQLVYASQGTENPPWVVDSLDLRAQYAGSRRCSYVRFGARDVRKTCVSGDTLLAYRDSTQQLSASRPLKSGMTLTLATASGGSAVYETAATETITVSGLTIPVIVTTVTTRDSTGKTVRRLRERFALSLGTATGGVFEALQADGTWKVTQEFSLIRIVQP